MIINVLKTFENLETFGNFIKSDKNHYSTYVSYGTLIDNDYH